MKLISPAMQVTYKEVYVSISQRNHKAQTRTSVPSEPSRMPINNVMLGETIKTAFLWNMYDNVRNRLEMHMANVYDMIWKNRSQSEV